jgi:hypothetical protein
MASAPRAWYEVTGMMLRAAAALWFAICALACAASPTPCMGVGTCPEGSECLANRCTVLGADPVAADTRRMVVTPASMAVVSATSPGPSSELPPAITFGGSAGAAALYLDFPAEWLRARHIEAAFLILDPMPGTPRASKDVRVRAWRVAGDWDRSELTWLAQPQLAPPSAAGIARTAPPMPLRVDVTSIVRYLAEHRRDDHGIALKAGGGSAVGASFATGASGGNAPRLELYVR